MHYQHRARAIKPASYTPAQVQRYEGASTIFGPHTLDAYIQEFRRLAADMAAGRPSEAGPPPPDLVPRQWSLLPPVVIDSVPSGARLAVPSGTLTACACFCLPY